MSVFANRWREWATLLVGLYLFFSPWISGASADDPSSANAGITGLLAAMVALWTLVESPGPRAGNTIRIVIGVWLLASPFVLGFVGSGMAWSAWITGVLMLTLTVALNLVFDLQGWLQAKRLSYRAYEIAYETSPQEINKYTAPEEHPTEPERLSRQITERAYQIHHALRSRPSEIEAEMCALGYQACMDDMTTLARLIDKELPESTLLRRLRLKATRDRSTRSLSLAYSALPQDLRRSSLHGKEVT